MRTPSEFDVACALARGEAYDGRRHYQGAAIWVLLRQKPGLSAVEIGRRLGLPRKPEGALKWLKKSGHVYSLPPPPGPRNNGGPPGHLWYIVAGSRKPKDKRGKCGGSREALLTEWRLHPNSLKQLKSYRPAHKVIDGSTLGQCWAITNFSTVAETADE